MSGDGSITRTWGDGEHTFRLRIGELRELEEKRDAGSFVLYQRLANGTCRFDDIRETLRLGLIGGGMAPSLALGLVAKYAGPTTFIESLQAAQAVISAALFGDPGDMVGKIAAGILASTATSMEDAPNSQPSSEQGPQSAGPSTTLTDAHFGSSRLPSTAGSDATVPAINGRSL